MRKAMAEFDKRHDRVSSRRQRSLSNVVITVNISLYVLYEAAVRAWGWKFHFGPDGRRLFMTVWIASLLFLLPASGIPAAISRALEESTPLVLFGMVLAGQQLGRFRTNSRILVSLGTFLVLALFLYERVIGLRTVPDPPAQLEFFILASSFLIPALFAHLEKRPNYRAKGDFPPPQYVEVYRDERYNAWRYALYEKHSPLDPVIDLSLGKTVDEVRSLVEEKLKSTGPLLGIQDFLLDWPDSSEDESLGYIVSKESS